MGLGECTVEDLVKPDPRVWNGRSVFMTGHTGFKGGWLALWLHQLGARVHGYALDPVTDPSLFEVTQVGRVLSADWRADLADLAGLRSAIARAQPDVVFHLAAQPLVRASYADPIGTLATNVMGTAHLLEAVRSVDSVRAVVIITTDKVYENREWAHPYREADRLGGHDPYSASKAAAEIVAASYRLSFFAQSLGPVAKIATARAGNVIGGGDWSSDRLVPDCLAAFARDKPVRLRNPQAVRPWQHVLEPLAGYLLLAQHLLSEHGQHAAPAWNFGPDSSGDATVAEVGALLASLWGDDARIEHVPSPANPHEAGMLRLDSTVARTKLGWTPRWPLRSALSQTVNWYRAWLRGDDMAAVTRGQIGSYQAGADS